MPTYDWKCHVCKAKNSADVDVCKACGFTAVASGEEIGAAASGRKIEPWPSRKQLKIRRREEFAALPLWKRPVALVLWGAQFAAALSMMLTFSFYGIFVGIVVLIFAESLYRILVGGFRGGYRRRTRRSSRESRRGKRP
jgi:hypothetical protein